MLSRQLERRISRQVGEHAALAVLGQKLNRKSRRYLGRVYGNAGWRMMKGITGGNGYHKFNPHRSVFGYVATETKRNLYKLMAQMQKDAGPPPLPPLPEVHTNVKDASTETPSE